MFQESLPKILSGITVRDERLVKLKEKFKLISPTPELAIIQVGNRIDSTAYIKAKIAFAKKIGIITHHIHLQTVSQGDDSTKEVSQQEIINKINECNSNPLIKGIIVQLPLPEHIDKHVIINTIDPKKDIDGLTDTNKKLFSENDKKAVIPATARGIIELLNYYKISLKNKKVTVIGRSDLVGKPIAQLCVNAGAIVNVAHSKTVDLVKETKDSDIIIVAVGKRNLIGVEHVHAGQIIIDVGINRSCEVVINDNSKLVGDVDFPSVCKIIGRDGSISPVPGGVGPMTVLCLFENLLDLTIC